LYIKSVCGNIANPFATENTLREKYRQRPCHANESSLFLTVPALSFDL
jgi:hypothetical protein